MGLPRLAAALLLACALSAAPPAIASKTTGFEMLDGLFPLYWDAAAGKLWLEVPRLNSEFLYITSLPAGIGSNDMGLDRGQLGATRVVRFERHGPRLLLVQSNYAYRALSESEAERLQQARQGSWRREASRSALYRERTRNFPKNTEMEAIISFTGGPAGAWLREVSPSNDSLRVRQHHSFVELPPAG
jgi:hypothetical protein